jgi:hypothetical protein
MKYNEIIAWIDSFQYTDVYLLAHQNTFDQRMLEAECGRAKVSLPKYKFGCTMEYGMDINIVHTNSR